MKTLSNKKWLVIFLFGMLGQIAWSVENMYFNLFVFDTIAKDLDAITLMVQLSGITATVVTLIAGVLSDKLGNRRSFISWGYLVWGITVALFGMLSPALTASVLGVDATRAVAITLVLAIIGDCVMTLFGSTANDAAFNAWVTDNTESSYRGKVEGVLAILPLIAMLIVAGGFGILVEAIGYKTLFLILGILISVSGVIGIFTIEDSEKMEKSGGMKDIFYGFYPSSIKSNPSLYLTLLIIMIYGIATQIFMPYLIIYMKTYLSFTVIEYSLVFGLAILIGAGINIPLTRLSDRLNKPTLMYFGVGAMSLGLIGMFFAPAGNKAAAIAVFGIFGFVMITGYIFVNALTGSTVRDYTPQGVVGKLQGVRMVFSVLIPMLIGPAIGNLINKSKGILLEDAGADAMTTAYIPCPEIFLVAGIFLLLTLILIPVLVKTSKTN
ncbi:MAG: MFS transporter [Clostridia bacterium]|nr:MFS transporter [Clostridia bacterium]